MHYNCETDFSLTQTIIVSSKSIIVALLYTCMVVSCPLQRSNIFKSWLFFFCADFEKRRDPDVGVSCCSSVKNGWQATSCIWTASKLPNNNALTLVLLLQICVNTPKCWLADWVGVWNMLSIYLHSPPSYSRRDTHTSTSVLTSDSGQQITLCHYSPTDRGQ